MDIQYFSHDYNASLRDIKLIKLRKAMGYEGIGMYWSFVEFLYEHDNQCPTEDYEAVCMLYGFKSAKFNRLVSEFDLFIVYDGVLSCRSIGRRLGRRQELSQKRAKAVNSRIDRQERSEEQEPNTSDLQDDYNTSTKDLQPSEVCKEFVEQSSYKPSTKDLQPSEVCKEFVGVNINIKEKENNNNTPLPPQGGEEQPQKKRSSKSSKFNFEIESKPEWVAEDFALPFKAWIDYKLKRGQGYATDSAKTCYNRLLELSGNNASTAKAVVEQSIGNNWAGLFALNRPSHATNPMVFNNNATAKW